MKRNGSSYKKASIAMAVALIAIGAVLWAISASAVSAGVTPVDVEVKNDDEMVSIKENFTTIATQRLTIVALEIEIEMLTGQSAKIEFDTDADFADAFVIDEKGKIIGSYEFAKGIGDIDFSAGKKSTVIILSPGDDDNYGSNGGRQQFLQWCKQATAKIGRTISSTRNIILDNSVGAEGSSDSGAVIVVKTIVAPLEITDVSGEWDEDELEITGESNLPRRTEVEWRIFGETGATKAKRDGKIDFDIDLEGIDTSKDCVLELRIGNWYEEFELDPAPEPTEQGMSIKPKVSPKSTPRPTLELTPKPTPRLTPAPTLRPTPMPTPAPTLAPTPTPTPTSKSTFMFLRLYWMLLVIIGIGFGVAIGAAIVLKKMKK